MEGLLLYKLTAYLLNHALPRLLIQVHDELVYEILDAHVECMIEHLKEVVESKHLLADYTCSELSVCVYNYIPFSSIDLLS